MKYYIKAKNTETGESMVMTIPVFTSRKKAQEWADEFEKKMMPHAKAEVVSENEK